MPRGEIDTPTGVATMPGVLSEILYYFRRAVFCLFFKVSDVCHISVIEAKKGVEIFGGVNNNSHICDCILFVFLKKAKCNQNHLRNCQKKYKF